MQKIAEPTLTKLLQQAVDEGQVVFVREPSRPPTPTTPLLCDRDETVAAFCALFELKPRESQMLMQLLTHSHCTKENLYAIVAQTMTPNSAKVFLCHLRRKLARHGIWITHGQGLGYFLHKEAREEIYRRLAEYDARITPTRQPKPDTHAS
jgi:hypothetical protein